MNQHFSTVGELQVELDRQRKASWDIITEPGNLSFVVNSGGVQLSVTDKNSLEVLLPLNEWAKRQVCQKLEFPWLYYQKCENAGEYNLLSLNLNVWLDKREANLMVRTLDDQVRAVLSDSYMYVDNISILLTALHTFKEIEVDAEMNWGCPVNIWRSDLSDTHLYLKAGIDKMIHLVDDEYVMPGIIIKNSEVGASSFCVQPALLNPSCKNIMASVTAFRRIHIGKQQDEGVINWSERSKQLENEAIRSKVIDCIRQGFAPAFFQKWIDAVKRGVNFVLECKRETAVEVAKIEFGLGDGEADGILRYYSDQKRTMYGLSSAVTRYAQDVHPDRAVELEVIGGQIAVLPGERFNTLVRHLEEKNEVKT